ncbi:MAG: NusG domain II-containing protein [Selenomonadaceae bacterium]
MLKKWDIILIALLICLSFLPELLIGSKQTEQYSTTYAEITLNGRLYKTVPLSSHHGITEFTITTEQGINVVEIKDAAIAIIDADCPDHICINMGFIEKPGQIIVCLPHKLMIEVKTNGTTNKDDIIPAF